MNIESPQTQVIQSRQRQIKIGLFRNESLAYHCSAGAHLLYTCLNCYTDRADFLRIREDQLCLVFFPRECIDRQALLSELEGHGLMKRWPDGRIQMLQTDECLVRGSGGESAAAHSGNRRAARRNAFPAWADRAAINEIYAQARKQNLESGEVWHVDHVIPLQHPLVCGLHVPANLAVVTAADNLSKSNSFEVH